MPSHNILYLFRNYEQVPSSRIATTCRGPLPLVTRGCETPRRYILLVPLVWRLFSIPKRLLGERNRRGYSLRNHGRPWACEREGPVPKKMLWKVGVYSCLLERLIRDGRDSAKRVVSEIISPSVPLISWNLCPKASFRGGWRRNRLWRVS